MSPIVDAAEIDLAAVWEEIAAGAPGRDAAARFPGEAFAALGTAGVLGATLPDDVSREREWELVRAAARADGSVGRLLDGHFNAVQRIALLAPSPLRESELDAVARGERWLGVWGADPAPGEGEPARLDADGRVRGTKVFCSGAGGLHAALVTVRDGEARPVAGGPPRSLLALLEVREGVDVAIDRDWFRGSGMRASVSHRVTFEGVAPLALMGVPGELSRDPWFSRDAMRTAATWIGLADAVAEAALAALAARPRVGELEAHAAGRLATARATCDAWMAHAARAHDDEARAVSVAYRAALLDAARQILATAASACGTRPFATAEAGSEEGGAGTLDRARRDLELFLFQHRIDPLLARHGRELLDARRPPEIA